jgi:two-component system, sensor histidine kinase and response regulator
MSAMTQNAATEDLADNPPRTQRLVFWERYNTPITVTAAGLLFLLDRLTPSHFVLSTAYVTIVLLSLWAPTARGTYLTATLCTLLSILDALLTAPLFGFWSMMLNRSLSVLAFWMTAFVCLSRWRSAREQARAVARAERALDESRQVRAALTRAEAAETAARQAAERLEMTQRAGRVGTFDIHMDGGASYLSSTFI